MSGRLLASADDSRAIVSARECFTWITPENAYFGSYRIRFASGEEMLTDHSLTTPDLP